MFEISKNTDSNAYLYFMLVFKIMPFKTYSSQVIKKRKVIILNNRPKGGRVMILCIVAAT